MDKWNGNTERRTAGASVVNGNAPVAPAVLVPSVSQSGVWRL